MPDVTSDWLIFDCPACRKTVKMSGELRGQPVACPFCHTTIEPHQIPKGNAPTASPTPTSSPRSVPPAPNLRGHNKVGWELNQPGKKPVARTTSDPEPELPPPSRPAEPETHSSQPITGRHARPAQTGHATTNDGTTPKKLKRPSRRHRRKKRVRVLVALFTLLITGAAVFLWLSPEKNPIEQDIATTTPTADTALPALPRSTASSTITDQVYHQVVGTVDKFLTATTLESLLDVVRDNDRVRPLIDQWLKQQAGQQLTYRRISPRAEIVNNNGLYSGYLERHDGTRHIFAVLPGPSRWFFDLESFTEWNEITWDKLGDVRPFKPVLMRVLLQSSDYYAGSFADQNKYVSFRLHSLDHKHGVYAYLDRTTPLFSELQSRLRGNPELVGLVKIRFLEGATTDNQTLLLEWVANGWALPPTKNSQ